MKDATCARHLSQQIGHGYGQGRALNDPQNGFIALVHLIGVCDMVGLWPHVMVHLVKARTQAFYLCLSKVSVSVSMRS